jgi:hypothetical protein
MMILAPPFVASSVLSIKKCLPSRLTSYHAPVQRSVKPCQNLLASKVSTAGDEQMSLIYSMLMSVDGYVEDEHGRFDFAAPTKR